jgi:hypothetical protein
MADVEAPHVGLREAAQVIVDALAHHASHITALHGSRHRLEMAGRRPEQPLPRASGANRVTSCPMACRLSASCRACTTPPRGLTEWVSMAMRRGVRSASSHTPPARTAADQRFLGQVPERQPLPCMHRSSWRLSSMRPMAAAAMSRAAKRDSTSCRSSPAR